VEYAILIYRDHVRDSELDGTQLEADYAEYFSGFRTDP
jgi:hypothetical protein